MCWRTGLPFSQSSGSIYKRVALQVTLKIATREHVFFLCFILQSLWKILYSLHYVKKIIYILKYIKILIGTTLSFPNFGCDLSLPSLCKLTPLVLAVTLYMLAVSVYTLAVSLCAFCSPASRVLALWGRALNRQPRNPPPLLSDWSL